MFSELKRKLTVSISVCIIILLVFYFFTVYFSYSKILLISFSEKDNYFFAQTARNYKTAFDSIESSAGFFLNYISNDISKGLSAPSIRTMQRVSSFSYGIGSAFLFKGQELLAFSAKTANSFLDSIVKDERTMDILKRENKCWTYIPSSEGNTGSFAFITGTDSDAFSEPIYLAVTVNDLIFKSICTDKKFSYRSFDKIEFVSQNGYSAQVTSKSNNPVCRYGKTASDSTCDREINLGNGIILRLTAANSYITGYLLLLFIISVLILITSLVIMRSRLKNLGTDIDKSLTKLHSSMKEYTDSTHNGNSLQE